MTSRDIRILAAMTPVEREMYYAIGGTVPRGPLQDPGWYVHQAEQDRLKKLAEAQRAKWHAARLARKRLRRRAA